MARSARYRQTAGRLIGPGDKAFRRGLSGCTLECGHHIAQEQLRKDAKRNREAILDAARELFAESTDVAMCEVGAPGGVGQATLYRNFPDRRALAAEILGENVERIARLADEHAGDPDAFFVLLRSLVERMVHLYAVSELARQDACVGLPARARPATDRRADEAPAARSEGRGTLRREHVLDDVLSRASDGQGRHGEGARGPRPAPARPGRCAHAGARWPGAPSARA